MYSNQYMPMQERFPYTEAADYTSLDKIIEAYPHLKLINKDYDWSKKNNLSGIVIRSANDDNVHKVLLFIKEGD